MVTASSEILQEWATSVLVACGLRQHEAAVVAASLAFADRRGVSTHGVMRLSTYVDRILAGGINSAAKADVVIDVGALVVLDADAGPGASTGVLAADLAVERARAHGIGCVLVRNANHFGASAFFTNRIADTGMLGIAACNTEPVMCAPFGGAPVLGTNPIAVAVPLPADARPQLDMATTVTSYGRLLMAAGAAQPIPLGWAVDGEGQPTTSAMAGLGGALLPIGGPKGFGLAFAVDALLALAGAEVSTGVAPLDGDASTPQRLGHLFLAIQADAVAPLKTYQERIAELVKAIHVSAAGMNVPPAIVPGEPELNRERLMDGKVELTPTVLADMSEVAVRTGVALPETLAGAASAAGRRSLSLATEGGSQ